MSHVRVLSGEELEARVRGEVGAWDKESLRAAVRADHGYKESSPQMAWLIDVMAVRPPRSPPPHAPPELARAREPRRPGGSMGRV